MLPPQRRSWLRPGLIIVAMTTLARLATMNHWFDMGESAGAPTPTLAPSPTATVAVTATPTLTGWATVTRYTEVRVGPGQEYDAVNVVVNSQMVHVFEPDLTDQWLCIGEDQWIPADAVVWR
jgi:hypothetical protein